MFVFKLITITGPLFTFCILKPFFNQQPNKSVMRCAGTLCLSKYFITMIALLPLVEVSSDKPSVPSQWSIISGGDIYHLFF